MKAKRRRYGAVTGSDLSSFRDILLEVVSDVERVSDTMASNSTTELQVDGVQTFGKAAHMLHQVVGQLEMGLARERADRAQAKMDGKPNDK